MTEENESTSSQERAYPEIEYVVQEAQPRKRSLLSRIGCGVILMFWFAILLLPLFFFILAVQGDITISRRGDIPDKHQHPLFQVMLLMDANNRGLQFTSTSIGINNDTDICIETNVSYFMWQGDGESAQYCDCYERDNSDVEWSYTSTEQGECKP